jgi:uncharacterized Ntn-hydrolase superfamily protein
MTFSISARCARTGMFGVAVASSSPAVAARCAHARAGVGAVATQNITDPTIGRRGLDAMASGLSAPEALAKIKQTSSHIDYRQIAFVDRNGLSATHSGTNALGIYNAIAFENGAVAGNLLASENVLQQMADYFISHSDMDLGDRLIGAMQAAIQAGGEAGPVHSAGMVLVRDVAWPVADLRVDWHETNPVGELALLWERWKPQMDAYVTRALNPTEAPSFGVPGDK